MNNLNKYLEEVLGLELQPAKPIQDHQLGGIPLYIGQNYRFDTARLFNREIAFVKPVHLEDLNIQQVSKNLETLRREWPEKLLVLVLPNITAINRRRLIDKQVNFIVPGKQLFLPDMLIDLQETFSAVKRSTRESLTPSAQFLLIYHLLHRHGKWKFEENSLKAVADKFNYTAMTVTKAADNLRFLELADLSHTKEKSIRFRLERNELWNDAEKRKLLINPVLKRFYVDEKPEKPFMLMSNESALPEYSDMNPSRQKFFAMAKTDFYAIAKSAWKNMNEYEGNYCIEVWKYDPMRLAEGLNNDSSVVDPLSLYLSLKDTRDERIEMALEQIIEKHIW